MKKVEKSIELAGRTLKLSTGRLAEQAGGAVLASYGETFVLATVVSQDLGRELDYFPMTVDYQERLYAGGRIKGSKWVKREGRPTDEEILSGRLIDRSLRPLFPKTYKKDVQLIVMVLSVDLQNDPSILAGIAASAAVAVSPIPWKGPVAVLRVGLNKGKYLINPTDEEMEESELDLITSATKDAIVMIEAGAKQATEIQVLEGIKIAQSEAGKVISLIEDLAKEVGTEKEKYEEIKPSTKIVNQVKKLVEDKIEGLVKCMVMCEGVSSDFNDLVASVSDNFEDRDKKFVAEIIDSLKKDYIRNMTLKGKRADGRKHDEIRQLSAEVGVLPRTHGSAIFARGQTQVLTVATLGAPSLGQLIESAEGEEAKQYMHHYSMPPYATGETGRIGSPNRREIGHGALAERALTPVIPDEEIFPYAIRVVSEVMSSNGSSSMASVCGSTLSLMDAGVPLKEPVSGIAMGLMIEDDKNYAILSDIMGFEDFNGDMDFKVAGTQRGITAMQLDVKTLKLNTRILEKALEQAKVGRDHILKFMLKTLGQYRETVSSHAPKIKLIKVPVEKIGELIGPGGKNIKRIIAETGAQIDVNDDGSVFISATTNEAVKEGVTRVEAITKEPLPGEIYKGVVKRIQPFGAFVEILPGREGMVHVSDMSEEYVKDPSDIINVGQNVEVRVKEVDEMGRLNLSLMLDPGFDLRKEEKRKEKRGNERRFDKSGARPSRGGPHFPTSRFLRNDKRNSRG
ncbi:MAG: polyribonucleotide nucleotidyltransferase [Bacteroidetes bacterium RBG_13_44_24]|nr:MAG: polyribonucleotide nucleotidyltransferase [Bacteroidetes bacterium RBG_13_44_24]